MLIFSLPEFWNDYNIFNRSVIKKEFPIYIYKIFIQMQKCIYPYPLMNSQVKETL